MSLTETERAWCGTFEFGAAYFSSMAAPAKAAKFKRVYTVLRTVYCTIVLTQHNILLSVVVMKIVTVKKL